MVELVYYLTNLLFFDISLLYYGINFRSSIIFCLFCRDIYVSFGILSIKSCIFCSNFNCFCFHNFIIVRFSQHISNFITNQITSCSCCFLNSSFCSSFQCIFGGLFSMIKKFLIVLTHHVFTYVFTNLFAHIFSKRHNILQIFDILDELNNESFFIFYTLNNN